MASQYEYKQHPHVEARKQKGPAVSRKSKAAQQDQSVSRATLFNNRLGLSITKRVGTMWAAYLFFALTLISLPSALNSGNVLVIVSWVAQTFLQLVLLPIIIVGQNLQSAASDNRAIATYEDAGAILEEAKEIQIHLATQDQALNELITRMEKLEAKIVADRK
jgi:hypothetical protein